MSQHAFDRSIREAARNEARNKVRYIEALVPLQPEFRRLLDRLSPMLARTLQEYGVQSQPKGITGHLGRAFRRKPDPKFEPGEYRLDYEGLLIDYEHYSTIARVAIEVQVVEQRAVFSLSARDPELLEKILRQLVPGIKLHITRSERILYIPLRPT